MMKINNVYIIKIHNKTNPLDIILRDQDPTLRHNHHPTLEPPRSPGNHFHGRENKHQESFVRSNCYLGRIVTLKFM